MPKKRNNEIPVGINVNQLLDMARIYNFVSMNCLMLEIRCPVILTNQQLPDGIDSLWVRSKDSLYQMIIVSDRLAEDEVCRLIVSEVKRKNHKYEMIVDESFAFYNHADDMTIVYLLISEIALSLQVRCPMLTIMRDVPEWTLGTLKNSFGIAWNQMGTMGKTMMISLYESNWPGKNAEERILYAFKTMLHEMRHVYQHEYFPEKFFAAYNPNLPFEQYFLQPAEADAEAYAYRVLQELCGIDLFKIRELPTQVRGEVKKRADKMQLSYTKGLKQIGLALADIPTDGLIAV